MSWECSYGAQMLVCNNRTQARFLILSGSFLKWLSKLLSTLVHFLNILDNLSQNWTSSIVIILISSLVLNFEKIWWQISLRLSVNYVLRWFTSEGPPFVWFHIVIILLTSPLFTPIKYLYTLFALYCYCKLLYVILFPHINLLLLWVLLLYHPKMKNSPNWCMCSDMLCHQALFK